VSNPLSHASYLINLASPKEDLWGKSIDAMVVEWQRAALLGLDGVVVHPGAFVDSDESSGLERIVQAVARAAEQVEAKDCWLLLENTAGQLGWMLERTGESMRVGVCLDTCHAHAAGYDFSTESGFKAWEKDAKKHGVLDAIRALHLNDSKKGCGSRVDRHEHIGLGTIGRQGFERVLKHRVLKKWPMYLETEKGQDQDGQEWDAVNLKLLRQLAS
jgi:deoxyribonuclease-4